MPDVDKRLRAIDNRFGAINKRPGAIDKRPGPIDKRLADHLTGSYDANKVLNKKPAARRLRYPAVIATDPRRCTPRRGTPP